MTRRAEAFVFVVLRRQIDLRFGDFHGVAREEQCRSHDDAAQHEKPNVDVCRLGKLRHQHFRVSAFEGDGVTVDACHRYADKVNQVVSGKCKGESECARENGKFHNVDAEALHHAQNNRGANPNDQERHDDVVVDHVGKFRCNQSGTFHALKDGKIDNSDD